MSPPAFFRRQPNAPRRLDRTPTYHGSEQLAALTRRDGKREARLLEFAGEFLGSVELLGLALAPALLERLDLLAVGSGDRDCEIARQQEIAGVTGSDLSNTYS